MKAMLSFLLGLALNEWFEWGPWLAKRLVLWSAQRLDDTGDRERYGEEYVAVIVAVPGKLSPLLVAVGIAFNVMKMRRALEPPEEPEIFIVY
ncbi:MAG TPA: hypothetical protein VFO16_20605 [Pseudonocardiaceae bacterium]|nr:hypothetical protein [Pseudonocardiaceae bacterium]